MSKETGSQWMWWRWKKSYNVCFFLFFLNFPITYPQLTQAIVPWPLTVWATSDSSLRWESPDVATDTENKPQSGSLPKPFNSSQHPRASRHRGHCHVKHSEEELSYSAAQRLTKAPSAEERDHWVWDGGVMEEGFLIPFTGWVQEGGLSYISFQHLTIVWLSRGWEDYMVTQRLCWNRPTLLQNGGNTAGMFWQTVVCTCCMLLSIIFWAMMSIKCELI